MNLKETSTRKQHADSATQREILKDPNNAHSQSLTLESHTLSLIHIGHTGTMEVRFGTLK